jgi:uncharacterized protein (DUF1501 family)
VSQADRLILRPEGGPDADVLVAIFLRGGLDGVYAVPPLGDKNLHAQRAELTSGDSAAAPTPLDDLFGLHPLFAPLAPLYQEKLLAIVQAVGLSEPVLSHFDATRAIEWGTSSADAGDGWLGRHFGLQPIERPSPLRAVALGEGVPLVLHGTDALAINSLADIRLEIPAHWSPKFLPLLERMYLAGNDRVTATGRAALATLDAVRRIGRQPDNTRNRDDYPVDRFGRHLAEVARLIKADVGLEAAVLNLADFDSHIQQEASLVTPMSSFARGLSGFVRDLGRNVERVTIVVMSEFGRRIAVNGAGGTDHGRGTVMFVAGGGIRGGKVYGRWPGLAPYDLDPQGSLRVTTDYRQVLAEIVSRRLKSRAIAKVFPNFRGDFLGFTAPAQPAA